jgi:predicted dehydrogenase
MSLQLGAIGVGGLGHLQLSISDSMPEVSIVAASDISASARDVFETEFQAPAYEQVDDFLDAHADELDAVIIVTPHTLHYRQARACLERDLHVLLEKPMVTDVAEGLSLLDIADERDLTLQVGYQRHFDPAFEEIKRVIESGRIGDLHMVAGHLGQDWIDQHRNTWRTDPSLSGGGQLYDSGSHLLDALLWTTGGEPVSVSSQIQFDQPGIDVNSSLSLRLDRDDHPLVASVGLTGDGVAVEPSEGYFFWGTEGRIAYYDDQITVAEQRGATYSTSITGDRDFRTLTRRKLEQFVDSILEDAPPSVPGEYGLQVTALTEAAYLAAEREAHVTVESVYAEAREQRPL